MKSCAFCIDTIFSHVSNGYVYVYSCTEKPIQMAHGYNDWMIGEWIYNVQGQETELMYYQHQCMITHFANSFFRESYRYTARMRNMECLIHSEERGKEERVRTQPALGGVCIEYHTAKVEDSTSGAACTCRYKCGMDFKFYNWKSALSYQQARWFHVQIVPCKNEHTVSVWVSFVYKASAFSQSWLQRIPTQGMDVKVLYYLHSFRFFVVLWLWCYTLWVLSLNSYINK